MPIKIITFFIGLIILTAVQVTLAQTERARVIILSDMGHDPDDEQEFIHLLVASNMFDIEGLIAVTGRFFRPNPPEGTKELMPHLFYKYLDGYEKIYPNLLLHASGWKTADELRALVASGQAGAGVADVGKGKSSEGSNLIIKAALRDDPRPLHIIVNSGSNTLAQALYDYRVTHTPKEVDVLIAKLRVFDNGGQDEAGAWIAHEFPNIHWVRSHLQTRSYGGPSNENLGPHTWKPFAYSTEGQHAWAHKNIRDDHGALGALYPDRTISGITHYIEGGGTIPWMTFVVPGLTNPSEPSWGGWSGRYSREKLPNVPSGYEIVVIDEKEYFPYSAYSDYKGIIDEWKNPDDGKVYRDEVTPVWRWREAMWNDFKARMDWCVKKYADANHHPHAVLNGDDSDEILHIRAQPGEMIKLDASGSADPDKNKLHYYWWIYSEAGAKPYLNTSDGRDIAIKNSTKKKASFVIPQDADGRELHIILEVWDTNKIVPLVDYRRLRVSVNKRQ